MKWCTNRRALLAGAGAASLLTACGAHSSDAAPPAGSKAPSQSPSQPVSVVSAIPPGSVIAEVGQVPVGGGVVAKGVLVVQPVAGTFKAFDAACPHKGVVLEAPKDGVAACPAHRSTFAIADGARLAGPATTGLVAVPINVDGNQIRKV